MRMEVVTAVTAATAAVVYTVVMAGAETDTTGDTTVVTMVFCSLSVSV